MNAAPTDRRTSNRSKTRLWVDVQMPDGKRRVQATDVSRHGLFLEMERPPDVGRMVLLRVHLPGGPFEVMAGVARHGSFSVESMGGAGMKLFCLGSNAKLRWDRFVADVGGESHRAQERPSRGKATFLVQLPTTDALRAFFQKHVSARQIVYVTPPVRRLGADVLLVLVHPDTNEELSLDGVVEDLDPDRPLRMGVRLDEASPALKRRFEAFLAATANPVRHDEAGGTYTFVSPKLAARNAAAAAAARPDDDAVLLSEVVDEPVLDYVDKRALFDFEWTAEGDPEDVEDR